MKKKLFVSFLSLLTLAVCIGIAKRNSYVYTSSKENVTDTFIGGQHRGNYDSIPFAASGTFKWTQNFAGNVTAGVFNSSGKLLRTIFSNRAFPAGVNTAYYNGLLDDSTSATSPLIIKVEYDSIHSVWEGATIGNSGIPQTGVNKFNGANPPYDVCWSNGKMFVGAGYNEAFPAEWYTDSVNINAGRTWFGYGPGTNFCESICTDGNVVYSLMQGAFDTSRFASFIWGMKASDLSTYTFSSGQAIGAGFGSYSSAIGYQDTTTANRTIDPRGFYMKVQKSGNYLFVSKKTINRIEVYNKTTGAFVRNIAMTAPGGLAIDMSDNLWVCHNNIVEKYIVASDGNISSSGISNNTIVTTGDLDINPLTNAPWVCDVDQQVLRVINPSTGTITSTIGTLGGYYTSAAVTNTKWCWRTNAGTAKTFIRFKSDGSYALGDYNNFRVLFFSAANAYQTTLSYLAFNYFASVDANNPNRIFTGFLEFNRDYTKPLSPTNGSTSLVNNWSALFDGNTYNLSVRTSNNTVTFGGHTYCTMRGAGGNGGIHYICELVTGGVLRNTGLTVYLFNFLAPNGDLYYGSPTNTNPYVLYRRSWTGVIDGNGNPVWAAAAPVATLDNPNIKPNSMIVSGNTIGLFDATAQQRYDSKDFHVGFSKLFSNQYNALVSRGTRADYSGPWPRNDQYDDGNSVNNGLQGSGGIIAGYGRWAITGYHGEHWKSGQTNMYNIYDTLTGFMIGQFGTLSYEFLDYGGPGQDGNALSGALTYANGSYYYYHAGESFGCHSWRLDGMNSVTITTASFQPGLGEPYTTTIDLMKGLKRSMSFPAGSGWNADTIYATNATNYFTYSIGTRSYDVWASPSLQMAYQNSSGSAQSHYIQRDLGSSNRNLRGWSIKGEVQWNPRQFVDATKGNAFKIVDDNNKAIANFYMQQNGTNFQFMLNNQVLFSAPTTQYYIRGEYFDSFEIKDSSGILVCYHEGYRAATPITADAGANIRNPRFFKMAAYSFSGYTSDFTQLSIRKLTETRTF